MTEITSAQLTTLCNNSLNVYQYSHPYQWAVMNILAKTGLRVNEVVEASRWSIYDATRYSVDLEKADTNRLILKTAFATNFYDIAIREWSYLDASYSAVNYRIRNAFPIITFDTDSRRTTTHIYRYNFIKREKTRGQTNAQIKATMCHASQATTDKYISHKIYQH